MNDKLRTILFNVAATAVLVMAAIYPLKWSYTPYIFAVGAAGMAIARLTYRSESKDIRIKRLHRMETIAAILTVASSYFMFKHSNEWLLLLAIAAVLQLYAAFVKK